MDVLDSILSADWPGNPGPDVARLHGRSCQGSLGRAVSSGLFLIATGGT